MLIPGNQMSNFRKPNLVDFSQMSFEDLDRKHWISEDVEQESNRRVAEIVRNIQKKVVEKTDYLLLNTMTNEQLGLIATQITRELERRGVL